MKVPVKAIVAGVTAVAVVGGGIFAFSRRQPSKEVTVVPVSNVYTSYWGDSQTLDGFVTTGSLQEVRMTEGGFDNVAVKEGDTVKKGQTLVEFDNTQAELMLRGDLAKINLLKSQIAAFEKQITDDHTKIATLKKKLESLSSATPETPVTPPVEGEGGGTTTPTALAEIDHINDAVNKDDTTAGTATNPYRILCTKDAVVKEAFWSSLAADNSTANDSFVIDIYSDVNATTWMARWTITTVPTPLPAADWNITAGLTFDATHNFTGITTEIKPYGTLSLTEPTEPSTPDGPPAVLPEEPQTPEDIKAEIEMLYEDIDACQKQIDSSERDLRQAQITYEKNKLTQSEGKIIASIDGTVATLGDATTPVGEVFLRVQGASSYAVTLYVNELLLGKVTVGTTVQLMCYESGTMAPATITGVDPTPVTGYYSGGNANASTYQVTAEITDPNAQPRLNEWCQATLDGAPVDQPSDTIYIPLFLVREDDGGSYVMRADEDNRLQKCYITAGKSLWGSYVEVKSGVTLEDRLAFPYGNTVKEGAPTVDADYFDGY